MGRQDRPKPPQRMTTMVPGVVDGHDIAFALEFVDVTMGRLVSHVVMNRKRVKALSDGAVLALAAARMLRVDNTLPDDKVELIGMSRDAVHLVLQA